MSVPLSMSVSVWLVLPCVWASLGQLWVKMRGILIDLGAIIFFGRLRLSGKEGVTRIPESKRARQTYVAVHTTHAAGS